MRIADERMELGEESVVGNVSVSKNEQEMKWNTHTFFKYSRG
jgi:hypothetical protein